MAWPHPSADLFPDTALVIGDQRLKTSSGGEHQHLYAGTGKPTLTLPLAGAAEIDQAVQAACKALPGWIALPASRRRDLMLKLAQLIEDNGPALDKLQVAENGVVFNKAVIYRHGSVDNFRYNAGWIDKIGGDVINTWPIPAFNYTLDEPYGVCALIIPWNVPLGAGSQIIAAALAAGNTIVVKPPELSPFTALKLAELAQQAGFPPGVFNVVPGGAAAGDALVRHRGVDKIHFTGSGPTAEKIVAAAGLTAIGLELGGKSARIVFAEADLDQAVALTVASTTSNAGQGCLLGTRLLVEASIYDDFIERCKAAFEGLRVSDPFDPKTDVGPVVSEGARTRILGIIDRAKTEKSGRLVTGGAAVEGDGYFLQPTMFADVPNESSLAQNEVFGPVLAAMKFTTEEEAVAIANDTVFGLGAYIHTRDYRRAHRVGSRLQAGNVWINGFSLPASMPFGGVKQSGYGRVGGPQGLHEFLRPKNIWMAMS